MKTTPTLQSLVDSLGGRGETTALLALTKREQERWSFRELSDRALAFANGLVRAGVRRGESVVLLAENRPEWIAAVLGVIRAGAVAVPVDIQFADDDLAHVLRDSDARAVITMKTRVARVQASHPPRRARLIVLDADAKEERSWLRLLTKETTRAAGRERT